MQHVRKMIGSARFTRIGRGMLGLETNSRDIRMKLAWEIDRGNLLGHAEPQ